MNEATQVPTNTIDSTTGNRIITVIITNEENTIEETTTYSFEAINQDTLENDEKHDDLIDNCAEMVAKDNVINANHHESKDDICSANVDTNMDNDDYEECKSLIENESNTNYELKDNNLETLVCKLKRNRRSEAMKSLDCESFNLSEKDQKQAGFYTDNPMLWYNALQEYSVMYKVINRCEVKKNKQALITIVKIYICFDTTKDVFISINFVTGIITVKGTSLNDWIETEFIKVKQFVSKTSPAAETTNEDEHTQPKIECREDQAKPVTPTTEKCETETQIENLWSVTDSVKKSLQNVDASIMGVTQWVNDLETAREDRFVQIERKIKELEQRLSTRIDLFMEEIDKKFGDFGKKFQNIYDNKHHNVKTDLGNLKVDLQRQVTELAAKPTESLDSLKSKICNVETELNQIKSIDMTDIHAILGGENCYNEVNKRLESISKQFSTQEKLIADLQKNMDLPKKNKETVMHDNPNVFTYEPEPAVNLGQEQENENTSIDNKTEIIMCFDSNRQFIDLRKLWTINGTKIKPCGNWREVNNVIDENTNYTNLKYFFTNVGCNDIDYKKGDELFTTIRSTVEKIQTEYPDIKVIIGEITPRMDKLDLEVKATNTMINQYFSSVDNVYIAKHENLRNPDFYYDSKHLNDTITPRFAANIKRALNKAYGREYKRGTWTHDNNQRNNYNYHQRRDTGSRNVNNYGYQQERDYYRYEDDYYGQWDDYYNDNYKY